MATISKEEENFVRMSLLLKGVAPTAVRCKFDGCADFVPAVLPATIQRESNKLSGLKVKRVINQAQWIVLYPIHGNPDSKEFDITLMICLMRNLNQVAPPALGFDCLPPKHEITDGADLARIKHYRNYLAHLDNTKINNSDFMKAWTDVADAVGRLGGPSMVQECLDLKVKTLDQSNKEIMLEIKRSQGELKQSLQDTIGQIESQKTSQSELKASFDEKSKKIEELAKSYVRLRTDHDENTKEVESLAKSNASLKTDHEFKTKEVECL